MEVMSNKQSALQAKQSYAQGYTLYEGLTEKDWWWWFVAFDVPDAVVKAGDIIYQYVTIGTDTVGKDAQGNTATVKSYETVGCYLTVGETDLPSTVDVYTHPAQEAWSLNTLDNAGADNANIKDKAYDQQASSIKQQDFDEKW